MLDLWLRLVGIFLLRIGPQDLPARISALLVTIVAYAGLTMANMALTSDNGSSPGPVLVSVVMSVLLVRLLLGLRGVGARWLQTLTALFGVAAIFHVLNLPLAVMMTDPPGTFTALLAVMLFFWSFAVDGHIYRHALEIQFPAGLLVAVGLFALSYFLLTALLGPL